MNREQLELFRKPCSRPLRSMLVGNSDFLPALARLNARGFRVTALDVVKRGYRFWFMPVDA